MSLQGQVEDSMKKWQYSLLTTLILAVGLILGCAGSKSFSGSKEKSPVPRWFLNIPQHSKYIYAIGQSGLQTGSNKDSIDAVSVVADRIAACQAVPVEYRIAESIENNTVHTAYAAAAFPDPNLVASVQESITVLDTFSWGGLYYVLGVNTDDPPKLSAKQIERVTYGELRCTPSEWLNIDLYDGKYLYGLGLQNDSKADSWIHAENNAWASIIAQRELDLKLWTFENMENQYFQLNQYSKTEGNAVVKNARILHRWQSPSLTKYVLIRAPGKRKK